VRCALDHEGRSEAPRAAPVRRGSSTSTPVTTLSSSAPPIASANAIGIGLGKSNAEISRELYMSVPTVKAHFSRILEKLDFHNHVQIALFAHDAGET
jgi:hypothetical protein